MVFEAPALTFELTLPRPWPWGNFPWNPEFLKSKAFQSFFSVICPLINI